ncbi:MAG: hypothetical protein KH230_15465 [Enterocloster asparagiformis]|nr:hypothetical protein [Enterocloster asparagiformis]
MKTKNELKRIVREALRNEYGFSPASKDIVLMEGDDDGTYIAFRVSDKHYKFNSYMPYAGGSTVYVGNGTITRVE